MASTLYNEAVEYMNNFSKPYSSEIIAVEFSEAPATTIQFHTRNGNGALVWTFSTSAEQQKQYSKGEL